MYCYGEAAITIHIILPVNYTCGWLESGLERGWVLRALRHYLLVRLLNPGQPLSRIHI